MSNPLSQEVRTKSIYQERIDAFAKAAEPKISQEDWQQILHAVSGDALQALMLRMFCRDNSGKILNDRFFRLFTQYGDIRSLRGYEKAAVKLLTAAHPLAPLGSEKNLFLVAASYGSSKPAGQSHFKEPVPNHNPGHDYS